jgi:hypothetical protein
MPRLCCSREFVSFTHYVSSSIRRVRVDGAAVGVGGWAGGFFKAIDKALGSGRFWKSMGSGRFWNSPEHEPQNTYPTLCHIGKV